ncbi:MAG: PD-(D/E)XK nuclease family protein, partial [Planctomycetaceae bacterium]|nr:PD-(D/E)XK nuclease family protein [Planctomycetaceae bacterium]
MQREFLNWDMPVLETAADYLVRRYFADERIDMRKVLIVVTGAQAKRRLEELLQHKAAELDPAWFPPKRITTIGTFPELLYQQKNPAASDLVQQLAWSTALDQLHGKNPEAIKRLAEQLPAQNDWAGRLALGRLIAQLHLELAADRVDFGMVDAYCREKQLPEEAARWEVLAGLQALYLAELDAVQLWDIQTARAYALDHAECETDCDIILIGLSDLNRTQRAILDAVGERVTSLVFAPESFADMFDEHGCVEAERWQTHPLDIPDAMIEQAETPASQAISVLHWLHQLNARYSAQDIVIGVPDESVVPFLAQQLGQADVPHRQPAGTPVSQTPVFLLIESLANYLQTQRYSDLMTLLRHPDMERFVNRQLQREIEALRIADSAVTVSPHESWLVEFDTYYRDHLPLVIDGNRLLRPRRESDDDSNLDVLQAGDGNSDVAPSESSDREYHLVNMVYGILENLVGLLFENSQQPNDATTSDGKEQPGKQQPGTKRGHGVAERSDRTTRPTPFVALTAFPAAVSCTQRPAEWCIAIQRLLTQLYGPRKTNAVASRLADHLIEKSFEQLEKLYDKLADIPERLIPTMTAAEMLQLLLRMWASERIPPLAEGEAIELLGWLELLTDDAPAIAITGLNENFVPSSKTADMFLPDGMRRELQLEDNTRRYARDAYALSAIMASRENVRIIFGRRSVEGEPLLPSRLLFATDEQHIAERVRQYFAEPSKNTTRPVCGSLRAGRTTSDFDPKEPPKTGEVPDGIRVTEFRDYLQCPFRYYLRHRLRLNIIDDTAEELDGGAFGDIAHRVLKLFGRSRIKNSRDAGQIADYLSRQLDAVVKDVYGAAHRPVIAVQVEQLRIRLNAFAVAQAKHAAEGFEILHVEYSPPTEDGSAIVDVDGRPIKLRGRIDRVDFNHHSGKYVLLDYKTTAAGDAPEKTHRQKGEWVDLQLPLYEWIFSEHNDVEWGIDVGYVSLPKDVSKTGFLIADWQYHDFENARNTAQEVIRKIRREVVWP